MRRYLIYFQFQLNVRKYCLYYFLYFLKATLLSWIVKKPRANEPSQISDTEEIGECSNVQETQNLNESRKLDKIQHIQHIFNKIM